MRRSRTQKITLQRTGLCLRKPWIQFTRSKFLAPYPMSNNQNQVKLPKNLSFSRGGQNLSGIVTRISAEVCLPDGKRVFRTMTDEDLVNTSPAAQVNVTTPKSWTIVQKFDFMADMIKMIIDGVTCSLLITGSGGLGKSFSVLKGLKNAGLSENDGYVMLKGYSTPRGFYEYLYRNNGKLIVVDDCDSVFETDNGINILKAALDSYDTRTISWQSRETRSDDDEDAVPKSFEFTGRVIFISNLTQEEVPQPIRSRSMNIDLTMNLTDRVDRISSLLPALAAREGLTLAQGQEVMALIVANKDVVRDLNIRTAVMTLRVRKTAVGNWQDLALFQLIHN
jgi:hypothetical protein